jgi:nucleotide-binding universal stress UspA family protein
MNASLKFNCLLVPVDFSPASEAAFDQALTLARGDGAVLILLHVIDPALVNFATTHDWGTAEDVEKQMREQAKGALQSYKARAVDQCEIDTIVSTGIPFLEILRKAEDFAVDAIVIGKTGARGTLEQLLFGSTAEKVLRGSRYPVIVLPSEG